MLTRREFLTSAGAASALAAGSTPASAATGAESEKLFLPPDRLSASTSDRLPLTWSKERMRHLQVRLAERGYQGVFLTDQWNIIYFTGLFHTRTERMLHAFIPTDGEHPIWFYPALDRDLIHSWWYEDGDMYFDWLNVEGAAPQEGKVIRGPTQDLWRWALDGLKRRGFAGKKLAADKELVPSAQKAVVEVLGQPMASAAEACLYFRERKTPEELALTRRAYAYFDRIHAFARDLILAHGTDLTDFEVGNAATKYGTDLIMADIKHDGRPHGAVGIEVEIQCRVGETTAYPHPNQFLYNKLQRGKALQVEGVVQIEQGMKKYIYHRPAHGEGMEGHQPPYLALGDHTILDTGMCFSVEPGLFDPQTGSGANFSDLFAVESDGPSLQMSRLPWSEEWHWIKL